MSRWKFMQQTALLLAAMSTVPADAAVLIQMVGFEDK